MPNDSQSQLVPVCAESLFMVLSALNGPPHHIRELMITRGPLFDNPIDKLIADYTKWAASRGLIEIYPMWVFEAARHMKAGWIATNKDGSVFCHVNTPACANVNWVSNTRRELIPAGAPLQSNVPWHESLVKVP